MVTYSKEEVREAITLELFLEAIENMERAEFLEECQNLVCNKYLKEETSVGKYSKDDLVTYITESIISIKDTDRTKDNNALADEYEDFMYFIIYYHCSESQRYGPATLPKNSEDMFLAVRRWKKTRNP